MAALSRLDAGFLVGTQLAERGAKLHTIMSVLGHESPRMSMIYARISDAEVLRDYQSVLGPGAVIAGRGAEAVRAGQLSARAVDWLRSNFLKTELELGHCLRLPSPRKVHDVQVPLDRAKRFHAKAGSGDYFLHLHLIKRGAVLHSDEHGSLLEVGLDDCAECSCYERWTREPTLINVESMIERCESAA